MTCDLSQSLFASDNCRKTNVRDDHLVFGPFNTVTIAALSSGPWPFATNNRQSSVANPVIGIGVPFARTASATCSSSFNNLSPE